MFKINKSILIVCLISLFLLISQASAIDADSMNLNDINSCDINEIEEEISIDSDNTKLDSNSISPGTEINSNSISGCIKINYDSISKGSEINSNQISESDVNSLDVQNINSNGEILDNALIENLQDENIQNETSEISQEDEEDLEITEEGVKNTTGVVMAGDRISCGPASLATALNRFGMNLSLNDVSKYTNTTEDGTTMQSLIDTAKLFNFTAIGVEAKVDDLKENYIVHLNIDGNYHWTVVNKIEDNLIFLADSTEGNINMTIDEFNSYFTGNTIIISRMSESIVRNEISNRNMKALDKSQCIKVSGRGWVRVIVGYKTVWKYGIVMKYSYVLRPRVVGGHVSFLQWEYVYQAHPTWGKYKVKQPIYKYKYIKNQFQVKGVKKSK